MSQMADSTNSTNLRTRLKTAGLKSTPHRLQVYGVLQNAPASLTAEQIYLGLKSTGNPINLSTVYRILDTFVEKQLLSRSFLLDDGKALYEVNTHEHRHYLICTDCRRKVAINTCPLHRLEQEMEHETGFRIETHRLELYGVCPECCGARK